MRPRAALCHCGARAGGQLAGWQPKTPALGGALALPLQPLSPSQGDFPMGKRLPQVSTWINPPQLAGRAEQLGKRLPQGSWPSPSRLFGPFPDTGSSCLKGTARPVGQHQGSSGTPGSHHLPLTTNRQCLHRLPSHRPSMAQTRHPCSALGPWSGVGAPSRLHGAQEHEMVLAWLCPENGCGEPRRLHSPPAASLGETGRRGRCFPSTGLSRLRSRTRSVAGGGRRVQCRLPRALDVVAGEGRTLRHGPSRTPGESVGSRRRGCLRRHPPLGNSRSLGNTAGKRGAQ